MTLQSFGQIAVSDINVELGRSATAGNSSQTALRAIAAEPINTGTNQAMSDWYGYDNNPTTVTVSPTSTLRTYPAGSFTLTITTTSSWTASDNATWISLSATSGTGNGSITVSYTTNTGISTRFGTVTVSITGDSATCTVIQQGGTV